MRAADTNIVVRILTRDTPDQARAADRFIEGGAWVSTLALMEAIWVLASSYQLQRSAIDTAVEMLLNHTQLVLEDPPLARAALEKFRATPAIQFSDALILATSKRAGHVPLGTFDRKLASRAGTVRV